MTYSCFFFIIIITVTYIQLFFFFFIKQKNVSTLYIILTLCLLYVLPFCASAAWMCRSDLICLDMLFFPPSDIKISSTHFASRQEILFFQKEVSSEAGLQKSLQTVCWRQAGQEHELLEPCPVVSWVYGKLVWLRCCPACLAMPWWGVPRKLCLAYSQAWWW